MGKMSSCGRKSLSVGWEFDRRLHDAPARHARLKPHSAVPSAGCNRRKRWQALRNRSARRSTVGKCTVGGRLAVSRRQPQILPRLGRRGRGADLPAKLSTPRRASAQNGVPETPSAHRKEFSNSTQGDTSADRQLCDRRFFSAIGITTSYLVGPCRYQRKAADRNDDGLRSTE